MLIANYVFYLDSLNLSTFGKFVSDMLKIQCTSVQLHH